MVLSYSGVQVKGTRTINDQYLMAFLGMRGIMTRWILTNSMVKILGEEVHSSGVRCQLKNENVEFHFTSMKLTLCHCLHSISPSNSFMIFFYQINCS